MKFIMETIDNKPMRKTYNNFTVYYIEDEDNIYCQCGICGIKTIFTRDQLNDNTNCACEIRKLLYEIRGDEFVLNKLNQPSGSNNGVTYDEQKKKWRARITYKSKEYHLGYFTDEADAVVARNEAMVNTLDDFEGWFARLRSK